MSISKSPVCGEKDRNILIVYLKPDLTFGDLIPKMREYILERYDGMNNILGIELKEEVFYAVGKVKNIFEEIYKAGMTMYSDIHGRLEIDILAYALQPFYIKTGYVSSNGKAIIVITDKDIVRIKSMYNKKLIFNRDLMEEIEKNIKKYIVTDYGDVILRG